jgi:hypothetical protein
MNIPLSARIVGLEENKPLVRFLTGRYSHGNKFWSENPSVPAEEVGLSAPLGTIPEVQAWLWTHIHSFLPESKCWVVLGTPVLVNPHSGIIFAFAAGPTYALRLPNESRQTAIEMGARQVKRNGGATVDLSQLGDKWVIGLGRQDSPDWWKSAFEFSSVMPA